MFSILTCVKLCYVILELIFLFILQENHEPVREATGAGGHAGGASSIAAAHRHHGAPSVHPWGRALLRGEHTRASAQQS